jgi:hypothetical protein
MRRWLIGVVVWSSAGCVTTAWGSAPSPREGWVYMTGSRGAGPVVWLCPEAGDQECVEVRVTEVDE